MIHISQEPHQVVAYYSAVYTDSEDEIDITVCVSTYEDGSVFRYLYDDFMEYEPEFIDKVNRILQS
jgi:hypothetical protein